MLVQNPPMMTIIGNRPQFIKMAPVSAELQRRGFREYVVHTGQHYDENMSQVFFDELGLPEPDLTLGVPSGSQGQMTAWMLEKLDALLEKNRPRGVLIYGDTNSTLAAALAAVKRQIPIAHVEAGPRIYDMRTPEEINRIVADHAAQLRFCPDSVSVKNLAKENITDGVYFTGDVMLDAFQQFSLVAANCSTLLESLDLHETPFALLTIHRPNNTDTREAIQRIYDFLAQAPMVVVFPVHPRTEAAFKRSSLWAALQTLPHVKLLPALGYLDVLHLLNHCRIVLTDSGGLQKEGFFAEKPVLVLFHTTPWPQLEALGWQKICWVEAGLDIEKTLQEMTHFSPPSQHPNLFGDGYAAVKIVDILEAQGWFAQTPYLVEAS